MKRPILKIQEVPHDSPESSYFFQPSSEKPFLATPAAIAAYQEETILECLELLQSEAEKHNGIDYFRVFCDPDKAEDLWIIEDGVGGAITALLPSDY